LQLKLAGFVAEPGGCAGGWFTETANTESSIDKGKDIGGEGMGVHRLIAFGADHDRRFLLRTGLHFQGEKGLLRIGRMEDEGWRH
jgi:hypothetical protein